MQIKKNMNTEENISKEEIKNNIKIENNISEKNNQDSLEQLDLNTQLLQEKDKFLRLYADFDNYKKRNNKEKLDLIKYGNTEILSVLIPVIDDFERAIKNIQEYDQGDIISGIKLIQNKFINILKEKGLKKIETKIGDHFNADNHEAISQIPAPNEDLKSKILDIIETGYMLHDKVIRFTKVVVGS